jgi:hypothetical protein
LQGARERENIVAHIDDELALVDDGVKEILVDDRSGGPLCGVLGSNDREDRAGRRRVCVVVLVKPELETPESERCGIGLDDDVKSEIL